MATAAPRQYSWLAHQPIQRKILLAIGCLTFLFVLCGSVTLISLARQDASWQWSRHTASTISVDPGWADAGVVSFWIFAALALVGATRREARRVPWFVWILPLAMYLSVVFLAAETPRYRAAIDPFIVLLAAIAVTQRTAGRRRTPS